MTSISSNLSEVRKSLGNATLVAVSKMQEKEAVCEALAAGQRVFGENRVQEAQQKFPLLRQEYPDIELHLIGPLQANKAKKAVELFDVIETIDSPNIADELAKAVRKTGRSPRFYIEVNIGNEAQKAGVAPDKIMGLFAYCRQIGLTISGLMCIPPKDRDPVPYFKKMRALTKELSLSHLSMGMSADYQAAIACGATEVRIGTAIFGGRPRTLS